MPLTRRSIVAGSVAFAAASALPAGLLADALTPEERAFLARHPARLSATSRANILAMYRNADPVIRRMMWIISGLSRPKLRQFIAWLDATEAGASEEELAMLQRRFATPEPEGMA